MPAPQRHEDDLRRAILSRNFYGPYGKEFAAGEITGDGTPVGLDLYDFGARMYSPSNMRGLTMDPLISELEASIKRIKESGLWTPSE